MSTGENEPDHVEVDADTGLPAVALGTPVSVADVAAAIADDEDAETSRAAKREFPRGCA